MGLMKGWFGEAMSVWVRCRRGVVVWLVRSRSGVVVRLVRGRSGVVDGVEALLRQQAGTSRVCFFNRIGIVSTRLVRSRRGVVSR